MSHYITKHGKLDDYQPPPEILLQSAVDAMPSHIAILDAGADIIGINYAWQRFGIENDYGQDSFGLGENYLQTCEVAEGRDADEAEQVAEGIQRIMNEQDEIFRLEYPCHSPASKRWFTLQVARFEYQGDMRVITAHQNITDMKMAQQSLIQNQRRLQTIMDAVYDGIFTVDERGYIETVNPAVAEIFQYSPEDMRNLHLTALMPEPYCTQYDTYIRRHRRVNAQRYAEVGHEVQGRRRDGSVFPMYLAMSRAFVDGRWLFTGIVQDLTPRKQMQQELIEKERLQVELEKERELRDLKNRFMSMISHELRTPLSVILLSSDFLRRYEDRMSDIEKVETINTIQTQVHHLENLVDDVSALSRADQITTNVHTEMIDLIDLCGDVVANAQMLYTETHRILFDPQGIIPAIPGDAKLLRQVFTNLLSNAAKYSDTGTRVMLQMRVHGDDVVIRVIDNGIGIPLEDQPKLFEPFHRAVNVGARPGTGLGLAVTKRAVELHGGRIDFESIPDSGTTFTVTLPIDDEL